MQCNKQQYRAVRHKDGPMLVIAGPGSGKTHVLVERIVYLIEECLIPPEQVLVITFSKKAAYSMERRFRNRVNDALYPVTFGTFHAVFFHILQTTDSYDRNSIILPATQREYMKKAGLMHNEQKAFDLTWQNEMLKKLGSKKSGMGSFSEAESVLEEYDRICRENSKLDFDDMVILCKEYLEHNQNARMRWQNTYRYILVDEFQDINAPQYEVLKLLGGESANLFCVGDDDQSIYGFRGSRPELMQRFLEDYPECKTVQLYVNYRCKENIIRAANCLIMHNKSRIQRRMQLASDREEKGLMESHIFDSLHKEAEYVISQIHYLHDTQNLSYAQIAVLFRSTYSISYLAECFLMQDIPFVLKDEPIGLYDITQSMTVMAYMRLAVNRGNLSDVISVINVPYRKISRELFRDAFGGEYNDVMSTQSLLNLANLNYVNQAERQYHKVILKELEEELLFMGTLPPYAALMYLFKKVGLERVIRETYRESRKMALSVADYIQELSERSYMYSTIEDWVSAVAKMSDVGSERLHNKTPDTSDRTGVQLMTVHASKGLEYDAVFVIALQEGLFPHRKSLHADGIEEERRLMYVAMTRARKYLFLCGRSSNFGKMPSRFLGEIG